MNACPQELHYPGSTARPDELLRHADLYRDQAQVLLAAFGKAHARAPGHLLALQAIELYLNAFLRSHGEPHATSRGRQHDLERCAAAARAAGLDLRPRTEQHLRETRERREYLAVRYAAEMSLNFGPPSRMVATLNDVAERVHLRIFSLTVA